MSRKLFLVVSLAMAVLPMLSQNSTQGKEFWFSFMQNGYKYNSGNWVANTVMISAKRACSGTIKNTDSAWEGIAFSVEDNGITYVDIPETYAYNEGNEEMVANKSLVLRATDTVSVYICNIANFSFDASFVLPVESLGSEYIIQSDKQTNLAYSGTENLTSCFLVVAVEDETEVDITPSVRTLHSAANETKTVVLQAGQTYFVRSANSGSNRDLSGSSVFARNGKKVAVFNGNTLTSIPNDNPNGLDHIFEQALPVDSWGKQFAVTTSSDRARDIVKITSAGNDNTVLRNGNVIATLGYGESYEFSLFASDGSCFIETSEPSVVYLYNTTGEDSYEPYGSKYGDPSMVWIPPVEQKIEGITFCTFNHDNATIDDHFVNIVVENQSVGFVSLDGNFIDASEFQSVNGTDGFSFVRKNISHGTHHLSCESGLIAHVYGFGEAKGYAYCVGANVINLNSRLYVNDIWSKSYLDGLYMCNDEEASFRVETNYPIESVHWDFDDGNLGEGAEIVHGYDTASDYVVKAYVVGINVLTQQHVYDTMTMDVHVGEPIYHDETHILCDEDSFEFFGELYTEPGDYERIGTSVYGCDSTYILHLEMGFKPEFEIQGTHWPIGGSETYISLNDYAIQLTDERARLDTVLWQVDCPNWYVTPHGKGETCTLSIFTFLLEPVMLHAWAINSCDTIHHEFFIQTSYFDVDEKEAQFGFSVAPNPSSGEMTMSFGDLPNKAKVLIYNVQGLKVDEIEIEQSCREMPYSMPDVGNGLYYIVLGSDGKCLTRKVVLVR